MSIWLFITELVFLLGGAFLLGGLAQRMRQSPIIGYLLAGAIVGPLMYNARVVNQTAELGVSLLLFSIGLEFSFKKLRLMGRMALGGGTLQVIITLGLVTLVMTAWTGLSQALVIGGMVALSSTAVVMRVLVDRAEIDSIRGRSCLALLLMQDIAIVPLVIMVNMLTPVGVEGTIGLHILKTLGAAVGLVMVLYVLLYWIAPALLSAPGVFANRELSVLLAVSVGLGASLGAHALGLSPALGAFVAGLLLGESPFATQVQADIGALRIIMVTLFFAAMGMLAKPLFILTNLHWVLIIAAAIFVFKTAIIFFLMRLLGLNHRQALATGISLAQIGEFAFVLAADAFHGNLFSPALFDLAVSTTIVLMFAAPYMVVWALPLADRLFRHVPPASDPALAHSRTTDSHVLVIGFGPAGEQVAQYLVERSWHVAILDSNPQSRQRAEAMGCRFLVGDATNDIVLAHAGLHRACLAVVTVPDANTAEKIIRILRQNRSDLPIAARSRYNRHSEALVQAGATIVVDEETRIGHLLSREIVAHMQEGSDAAMACRLIGAFENEPAEGVSKVSREV